jgi:hypothetical protein
VQMCCCSVTLYRVSTPLSTDPFWLRSTLIDAYTDSGARTQNSIVSAVSEAITSTLPEWHRTLHQDKPEKSTKPNPSRPQSCTGEVYHDSDH